MKKFSILFLIGLLLLTGCAKSAQSVPRDTSATGTVPTAEATRDTVAPTTGAQKPSPIPAADTTSPAQLTAEDAKTLALTHAGLTADQVSRLQSEPDREWGGLHYDVEFYCNGYEYDYEIDAATGQILHFEKDRD